MYSHYCFNLSTRIHFNENERISTIKKGFLLFLQHQNKNGPIVQWIECKIPVLMIWVRIPVGSQISETLT